MNTTATLSRAWRKHAACASPAYTKYRDLWFPTPGDTQSADEAVRICKRTCPVIDQCALWALDTRQEFGVWGGLTEAERRTILKRRGQRSRGPVAATLDPEPCGTRAGHARHIRNGQTPCGHCTAAETAALTRTADRAAA